MINAADRKQCMQLIIHQILIPGTHIQFFYVQPSGPNENKNKKKFIKTGLLCLTSDVSTAISPTVLCVLGGTVCPTTRTQSVLIAIGCKRWSDAQFRACSSYHLLSKGKQYTWAEGFCWSSWYSSRVYQPKENSINNCQHHPKLVLAGRVTKALIFSAQKSKGVGPLPLLKATHKDSCCSDPMREAITAGFRGLLLLTGKTQTCQIKNKQMIVTSSDNWMRRTDFVYLLCTSTLAQY